MEDGKGPPAIFFRLLLGMLVLGHERSGCWRRRGHAVLWGGLRIETSHGSLSFRLFDMI